MTTLRAVAIEGGVVIATDSEGRQFHVEIDDTLRSRLRDAPSASSSARKLSPREIQTQIRAGMSADEVAHITGAPLDYIQRYEGPVLAEREYVVESALGVPVHASDDSDPDAPPLTFGTVIGERLLQLSARGTQWSSWKEEAGGWILKLSFSADTIDHDARWRFDPKKLTLAPLNAEAVALSQQGEIGSTLMPRLRALPVEVSRDSSRFDSAAFQLPADLATEPAAAAEASHAAEAQHAEPTHEPIAYGRGRVIEPRTGAVSIVEDKSARELGETADLLEALRRRRGEREAAAFEAAGFDAPEENDSRPPSTANIRVLGSRKRDDAAAGASAGSAPSASAPSSAPAAPAASTSTSTATRPRAVERTPAPAESGSGRQTRRGRTSMPTWDEIVFGARPDDEN